MSIKNSLCAALLTLCSCCMAQDEGENEHTLAGIRDVFVIVDDTGSTLPGLSGSTLPGLTYKIIESDVEGSLRAWGINSQQDSRILFLVDYIVVPEKGFYSISIKVMQWVQLVRDPTVKVMIGTWSTADSATNTNANAPNWTVQTIRDVLKKQIDKFIAAWLGENPGVKGLPH
jgi:hypothetical protein